MGNQAWLSIDGLQAVLDSDPKLAQYEDHFKYRFELHKKWKQEIESECGTLADFARVRVPCSWQGPTCPAP